jgi:hypothetical protein
MLVAPGFLGNCSCIERPLLPADLQYGEQFHLKDEGPVGQRTVLAISQVRRNEKSLIENMGKFTTTAAGNYGHHHPEMTAS